MALCKMSMVAVRSPPRPSAFTAAPAKAKTVPLVFANPTPGSQMVLEPPASMETVVLVLVRQTSATRLGASAPIGSVSLEMVVAVAGVVRSQAAEPASAAISLTAVRASYNRLVRHRPPNAAQAKRRRMAAAFTRCKRHLKCMQIRRGGFSWRLVFWSGALPPLVLECLPLALMPKFSGGSIGVSTSMGCPNQPTSSGPATKGGSWSQPPFARQWYRTAARLVVEPPTSASNAQGAKNHSLPTPRCA
jgi:hypothetical protein